MNTTCLRQTIFEAATQGFLIYGYQGFSLQMCAKAVGLQKASLYHYIHSKLDLAYQVMDSLEEQAAEFICQDKNVFHVTAGPALALVPARLWSSGQSELQQRIHEYYHDWRWHFIGSYQLPSVSLELLINTGNIKFFTWLGFWLMQSGSLHTAPSTEEPLASGLGNKLNY